MIPMTGGQTIRNRLSYTQNGHSIARAREIARNQESELFIHGKNGRIRERDSYGNDPHPPKG